MSAIGDEFVEAIVDEVTAATGEELATADEEVALGDGVGDVDLALDGTKGTDAGFKFDLMVVLPEEVLEAEAEDEVTGNGASRNFCNAFVAAACLAA